MDTSTKVIIGSVLVLAAGGGVYYAVTKYRRGDELDKLDSDVNAQLASQLHSIVDTWYFTDKDADKAVEVAFKIKDWSAVQTSYQKLYNASLVGDLQGKMDSTQYQRFLAALTGAKKLTEIQNNTAKVTTQNNPVSSPVKVGSSVRIKSTQALPLNLYNTPEDAMAVKKVGNDYQPAPKPNGQIKTKTTAAFAKVVETKLFTFTKPNAAPVNVIYAKISFLSNPALVRWIIAAALETAPALKGLGCASCNGKCGMGCSCNAMPAAAMNTLSGVQVA